MDELFGARFYGDNLDSILGSDSSEERRRYGRSWSEETMTLADEICSQEIQAPDFGTRSETDDGLFPPPLSQPSPVCDEELPPSNVLYNQNANGAQTLCQAISFPIGHIFPNDTDLEAMYPKESSRAFAALARDVQVVTNFHVTQIKGLGGDYAQLPGSPTTDGARPPYSIAIGLSDVINHLISIRGFMLHTLEMYKGLDYENGEIGVHPGIDEAPWVRWPYNRKRVFLTKLLSKYMGMRQNLRLEYTEISDYCVSHNEKMDPRETLFEDGQSIIINRSGMITLEDGLIPSPNVITAWARVINNRATRGNRVRCPTRTCLALVDRGESLRHDNDIVDQWLSWIRTCEINIRSTSVIFIPFRMRNHYTLLVVNFHNNKMECFDTLYHSHADQECWDELAKSIGSYFWNLLAALGDSRANMFRDFKYELINPPWSTIVADLDSGVSVMHLMECYNGTPLSIEGIHLEQEHVRVKLKIEYVSTIVLSTLNVYRHNVLASIPRFIEDKCSAVLCPSPEVLRCRNIFTWGAGF